MSADAAIGTIPERLVDPQARVIDYLRVSVTDRCNYGCVYCIPDGGVAHTERAEVLSFEEIAALVCVFASLGVRRVRLTGGEPTARRDLVALVRLLRAIPGIDDIALSTNGHLLPELAAPLRDAGVDRLNVSVDSLDADRFRRITRRGDLARVLAGIEAARAAGFSSIKRNTVAIRGGNDDEMDRICAWAWARGLLPRFIEEMPMADGRAYQPGAHVSAAEIRERVAAAWPGTRVVADAADGARGAGPARYFRLDGFLTARSSVARAQRNSSRGAHRCPTPSSSTPSVRRSDGATADSKTCIPSISRHTCCARSWSAPASIRRSSKT